MAIAGENLKAGQFVVLGDDGLVYRCEASKPFIGVAQRNIAKGETFDLMSYGSIPVVFHQSRFKKLFHRLIGRRDY